MNEAPASGGYGRRTRRKREEFQNLHEFVRKARANLNQNAWDYIVGAAGPRPPCRRNRMALDEIAFRPRVLRNVAKVDASVEVFRPQIALAGDARTGPRARDFRSRRSRSRRPRHSRVRRTAHMLSSVSEPGLEKVAEAAPGALRIFQLYVSRR